jgi:hypothetical protein
LHLIPCCGAVWGAGRENHFSGRTSAVTDSQWQKGNRVANPGKPYPGGLTKCRCLLLADSNVEQFYYLSYYDDTNDGAKETG